MEINEYFKMKDELQQQLRDLNKTFSEEHPLTQKFKGKIIKAYDYKDKCWSEPFKMRGVRLYGREPIVNGYAVLENGRIAEGLIRECLVHNENDIEIINN